MNNRKGFTLAEMVAVIAILMVLALVSTPFVKGYIDDAYYGKAQLFLRQFNEARLNFEKDYPGLTIRGNLIKIENDNTVCHIDSLYGTNQEVSPVELVRCHYIKFPTDLEQRYSFSIQTDEGKPIASMEGIDTSSKHYQKHVTINSLGEVNNDEEE